MKAVLLTGIGGVEKLKVSEVNIPEPKSNEVLIKVLFCGVNHLDVLIRSGKRPGPTSFPHILGSEIVGQAVNGDKVAVYPWTADGGTIGRTSWGGYAQFVTVPKKNLVKIPAGLKLEEVCALTLAGTTAYHLIERGKIENKSRVLVTGATGGVGTAVIQILKSKECEIICSTSHKNKTPLLKKIGAGRIVSAKNMVSEIKKLYPYGIEYAIDLVGGSVWSEAIELLSKNGTMIFCATSKEEKGELNIGSVFSRELNILGSSGGTLENLQAVLSLLRKGILKPVIDSILPLKDAAVAHQKIENQQMFGKILLKT